MLNAPVGVVSTSNPLDLDVSTRPNIVHDPPSPTGFCSPHAFLILQTQIERVIGPGSKTPENLVDFFPRAWTQREEFLLGFRVQVDSVVHPPATLPLFQSGNLLPNHRQNSCNRSSFGPPLLFLT